MAQQDEIILDVKVNTDEVRLKMSAALGAVNDYKAAQKELNDTIKQQGYATKEQAASLARIAKGLEENQRAVKSNMAILQAETMARVSSSSSLDDQRQALNAAQKAYAQLSGEAKIAADAEGGLRDQIKALSDSVKAQEAAMGDARRNVGNYNEAVAAAIPAVGTLNRSIQTLNKVTSLTPEALKGMAAGIKSATQAALKFIATPLGATIAAIAVVLKVLSDVFGKLSAAIKKNDDASTALARLYAQTIQPIIDATTKAFAKMAEWVGKAADAMANWLGGATEAGDAAENLVKATDELEEAERDYVINSAKRNKEIAELRSKATEAEKYSYAERKKFLQEAIDKERENLEEDKQVKKAQLALLEAKAQQEQDTSDETMNKIAAARAAMYQAEEQYFTGTRRLQQQMANFDKQEQAEKEKAQAKARQAQKEYEDFRIQVRRETEDALLALEKDDLQRELAQIKLAGEREVETLRTKLKRLRKTDVQAREDLQKLILAKEAETQQKQTDLIIQKTEERAAKTRAILAAREELGIKDAIILGEQRLMRAELEAERLRNLTQEEVDALYKTQEDYDAAVIAADTAVYNERETLEQEYYDRKMQRQQNEFDKRKAAAGENEVERARIELEQAQIENDQLVNMDEETKARLFSSQEQYEAAIIASNEHVAESERKLTALMIKDAAAKANAIAGTIGALSGLLDQFGEENKAAAIASKALALGQIAVQTGVAIAEGITAAQAAGPFPANIVAVATTLTTILTNIATAVSTVKSAKFATGGIVGGDSYTGDRVPIRANSGEMVLTREQQTRLFDAVSGRSDQPLGIDYGMMAQAMASVPAPVMVYTELQEFGDRVATINEIASV